MCSTGRDRVVVGDIDKNIDTGVKHSRHYLPILVVEDCEVTVRMISAILSGLGIEFHLARNGKQGVMAWLSGTYSCVLMDYQMPEMDGLEATALIRAAERESGSHTPIIGFSACADERKFLAAGMDDYLPKPASPAALRAKIALWSTAKVA